VIGSPPRPNPEGSRPPGGLTWLKKGLELLRAEWDRRFAPDALLNPPYLEAFQGALRKWNALGLFETLHRQAGRSSKVETGPAFPDRYNASLRALRSKEPPPPGAVPVGFLDYVTIALEHLDSPGGEEAAKGIVELGDELLKDPGLAAYRIDIFGQFPSEVSRPLSVFLPPGGLPAPPEPPPRIELQSFIGKVFRGYKIIRVLGRGGFGAVFLAEHPTLPVKRALKIFLDVDRSGPGFEKFREKCFGEARLQATLKDPNILEVVDAFEDQGYVILVMEYVDGPNLGTVIEEKNRAGTHMAPLEVLDLAIPIARGLSHAHEHGVVHRRTSSSIGHAEAFPRSRISDWPDTSRSRVSVTTRSATWSGRRSTWPPSRSRPGR
jgi:hypothetical protein